MIEYAIKIRREKIALSYEGYHRLWVQTNHTTIEYETIKESHAYIVPLNRKLGVLPI